MNSRILIVDDDSELRQLFRLILQRDGYEVIEAENGTQAIQQALAGSPALILLDVMMPGPDGFETCRLFKKDERIASLPVIFISALNDVQSHERGLKAGADDYLHKPVNPRYLLSRVRTVMHRRGIDSFHESAMPAR